MLTIGPRVNRYANGAKDSTMTNTRPGKVMMLTKPADSPKTDRSPALISPEFSDPRSTHAIAQAKGDKKIGSGTRIESTRRNGTSVRPRIHAKDTPSTTANVATRKPSHSELRNAVQYDGWVTSALRLSSVHSEFGAPGEALCSVAYSR